MWEKERWWNEGIFKGSATSQRRVRSKTEYFVGGQERIPTRRLCRAPSGALSVVPIAAMHLHKPTALPGLLPWGTGRTHPPGLGHSNAASQGSLVWPLSPVLVCELSESRTDRGLMLASLTGARPGTQHVEPTSKLVGPSACPLDWILSKAEARPGWHLLVRGQT